MTSIFEDISSFKEQMYRAKVMDMLTDSFIDNEESIDNLREILMLIIAFPYEDLSDKFMEELLDDYTLFRTVVMFALVGIAEITNEAAKKLADKN